MSNYSKITDYAAKDLLLHGDAAKAIKGTEVGAEFDAIATMSATKVDSGGALGTPSSGTLTSCTGLPISTGVSGLGTGVATALAVNIGSAGSPVTNGGALGTPSSGTLTNCTGLPLAAVTDSTTEALGVGSIELGHASDTTISRVSAGTIAVEGVNVYTTATGAALAGSAAQSFSMSTAAIGTNTTQGATTAFANNINCPAFRAYAGAATSIAATPTKVAFNTESFDSNAAFDNATNYRFQPTVAGWYQVNCRVQFVSSSYVVTAVIYVTGVAASYGDDDTNARVTAYASSLVYLNGSTDYVEVFATSATTQNTATGSAITFFEAFRVFGA